MIHRHYSAKIICDICESFLMADDQPITKLAKAHHWMIRQHEPRHLCPTCNSKRVDGRTKAERFAKQAALNDSKRPLLAKMLATEEAK